jgi:hypothetical protein
MKQQPHSSGPWSVTQNNFGGYAILDARGQVVCEIDGPYTPSCDCYEGDAALSAGSLSLLAACRLTLVSSLTRAARISTATKC